MKHFAIYGAIVDTDEERESFEDVTPTQFRAFIAKLDEGEELQIAINSPGGSVYGGIAISNMIRQLSANGHKTTAFVEGLAASIASVIMCACDKVVMGESSLVMIHNCWSIVQGDSNTLRKEADTMDVMNDAIISFYKSKFDLPAEVLKQMMDAETWFSGREAQDLTFRCEVLPDAGGFNIAAKLKDIDLSKFKNIPKVLDMNKKNEEQEEETKQPDEETSTEEEETSEEEQEEKTTEETIEELKARIKELEAKLAAEEEEETSEEEEQKPDEGDDEEEEKEVVTKAECNKRVSGMQSTMAKQMDAMKKDYEAKIEDFKVQMKAKDEELATVKAEATSLAKKLEDSANELSKLTSALVEKSNALDALNAGVNTPNETTDWKSLKGQEFFDWYKKTH